MLQKVSPQGSFFAAFDIYCAMCLCAAMFATKVLPRHRSGAVQFPRATPLNRKGEGLVLAILSRPSIASWKYPVVFTLYSTNSPPT